MFKKMFKKYYYYYNYYYYYYFRLTKLKNNQIHQIILKMIIKKITCSIIFNFN